SRELPRDTITMFLTYAYRNIALNYTDKNSPKRNAVSIPRELAKIPSTIGCQSPSYARWIAYGTSAAVLGLYSIDRNHSTTRPRSKAMRSWTTGIDSDIFEAPRSPRIRAN